MSLRVCGTVFTVKNSKSPLIWNTATVCDIYIVYEPAGSFYYDPSIHKNMLNYNLHLHLII